jgi:hypothetical protein
VAPLAGWVLLQTRGAAAVASVYRAAGMLWMAIDDAESPSIAWVLQVYLAQWHQTPVAVKVLANLSKPPAAACAWHASACCLPTHTVFLTLLPPLQPSWTLAWSFHRAQ